MSITTSRPGVRTFSVRVPETLYSDAHRIAEERKLSVNALVSEALRTLVDEAQDREMYATATLLGQDAEMSTADFAFDAQSEVVLTHE